MKNFNKQNALSSEYLTRRKHIFQTIALLKTNKQLRSEATKEEAHLPKKECEKVQLQISDLLHNTIFIMKLYEEQNNK